MLESHLVKIFEYGKIPMKDFLIKISETLGLDFYCEDRSTLYTLSSEFFVLDIENGKSTLIFVNETLNSKLGYIQDYLTHFLTKKHIFYYLLKYLVECTTKRSNHQESNGNLKKYKCICSCIFSGNYCKIFDLNDLENRINIFTHDKIVFPISYYLNNGLLKMPGWDIHRISDIFIPDNFSLNCIDQSCTDKIFYEYENIKVIGKSVFLDDKRLEIASFAFSNGCTVKESIIIDQKLNK